MRTILLVLLFSISITTASYSTPINIEHLEEGIVKIQSVDKSSNKYLWQSKIETQKIEDHGQSFVYMKENGAGIYGKNKKYKTWTIDSYFHFENKLIVPYRVKKVFKDRDGKTIRVLDKFYNRKDNKVICNDTGKMKSFKFHKDLMDTEMLGVVLSNFPFREKEEVKFHLLTHEPAMYKINIKNKGIEMLRVVNQKVECYKLEMEVDLGMLSILGAFVPKTYFWFETKAPHRFIKYEGLESGLGTPYIVMTRVE